jgi:hypothetical protein
MIYMKNFFFIAIVVVLIIVLTGSGFWNWVYSIFKVNERSGTSLLHMKSLSGVYQIYIDGNKVGEVGNQEDKTFSQIAPGSRDVKIVRENNEDLYFVLNRSISFLSSAQVELEWEAGPTLESSEGLLKYFSPIPKPGGAEIQVIAFPSNSDIAFNEQVLPNNTASVTTVQDYKIKVKNTDGFTPKEFDIKLRDDNSGNVPKDVRLVAEVYLYKKPFLD